MGDIPSESIEVLVFDKFTKGGSRSGGRLIGKRHSVLSVPWNTKARYSWDSPVCPPNYQSLGDALFLRVISGGPIKAETLEAELYVARDGLTKWTLDREETDTLCAIVFPKRCGAQDFNFRHFGAKVAGGRLAVIFLLPIDGRVELKWRTYVTKVPAAQLVEHLNEAADDRLVSEARSLTRDDGKNPATSQMIEQHLLTG